MWYTMTPTERSHLSLTPQLSHWLKGAISPDVESSGSLWRLTSAEPPSQFRQGHCQSVELSKRLSFENRDEIGLFLGLKPTNVSNEMDLWVRICPLENVSYLPSNLRLMVLDEVREVVMQATTRETQQIQLEFSGQIGEIFCIQLEFNNFRFFEQFKV
ncbi:hypothetical protein CKA32_006859 [Geitlerinema sp. FC II]|nr:hypothetical protein CKA32_006859 [Geitlerinema sp. FC II]